jgi:hypothetical protein
MPGGGRINSLIRSSITPSLKIAYRFVMICGERKEQT